MGMHGFERVKMWKSLYYVIQGHDFFNETSLFYTIFGRNEAHLLVYYVQ